MTNLIALHHNKDEKNSLSQVLTKLMKEANLSVNQLSRNIGLANTTIKRILAEPLCNPTVSSLEKIADFFGISTTQLLGKEPLSQQRGYKPDINRWIDVPVIGLNEVIDWPGEPGQTDAPKPTYVKTDLDVSENVFAIIGEGESLEPMFCQGTILIFEPERTPKNKDFALVLMKGKELPQFRQIFLDGSDIYVKSVNPMLSDGTPILLPKEAKIVGVLIQAKSTFITE